MQFRNFIETVYYHATTPENAESILRTGIDVSKQRGGLFSGFYLSPHPGYFDSFSGDKKVILAVEVDDKQIMDIKDISDDDLTAADEHWRMMSPGWKNTLITRISKEKGFNGLKNGSEIILFNDKSIKSIRKL